MSSNDPFAFHKARLESKALGMACWLIYLQDKTVRVRVT